MATVLTLDRAIDRLATRLGYDGLLQLTEDRILEALNAGLMEISLGGISGLTSNLSALTRGSIDLTVSSHTAGTAILTISEDLAGEGIFPGDYFTDASDQRHIVYDLVHDLGAGSCTINVGSPLAASLAGQTITLQRRSIELPMSGSVLRVRTDDQRTPLKHDALAGVDYLLQTGEPRFYDAGFWEYGGIPYLSLYPASGDATTHVRIMLSNVREFLEAGATITIPESVVNAWLEASRRYFIDWSGETSPVEAATASKSAELSAAATKEAATPTEFFER